MANKSNSSGNFFETLADAQQQAFDTLVENTRKFTNGNTMMNEALDKGTEMYKNTVNAARETVDKMTVKGNDMQAQMKDSTEKMNQYFSQWKDQQVNMAKQLQDMNMNFLNNFWNTNNMQQNWSNWMNMWNNQNQGNTMDMQSFWKNMNPAAFQSQWDKSMENMRTFWHQFQTVLNDNYQTFSKQFQHENLADTYKGMFNMSEGFSKFYEMWMPMLKSMQDKTFNMDIFSRNLNMGQYKEFMDKYFSFMPHASHDYLQQMQAMMTEAVKNSSSQAQDLMKTWKENMGNLMPGLAGNPYTHMLNAYNHTYGQMMNAMSPFAKMLTPNNDTKSMQEWSKIINDMTIYNIKNAELQHMVYEAGLSIMEKMAESMMHKMEHGEEMGSMMKLYQEYLNLSDKHFVELFETDEYSQLMSEVSTLKMQIKKAVETQMEKNMVNIPVATRSEMDEVYQTIYDLKKMVRNLEAKLHTASAKTVTNTETATAKKSTSGTTSKVATKPVAKKTTKRK